MAEPDVAGTADVPSVPDTSSDDEADADLDADGPESVAEVELGDDDFGGDDLFDGVDEPSESPSESEGDSSGSAMEDLDAATGGLSSAMNEGAARLAVVGLEDDEKSELQAEFEEVFGAFRLGHYAGACAEEYVLADTEDDVDPAWGLLGSVLVCSAVVVWMRPDGEEHIEQMKSALGGETA